MSKPTDIDLLYGLEPVIEPGDTTGGEGLEPFADIICPYCGEVMTTRLDLSAGSQAYVEDCQVCCQPMQISVSVADDGTLQGVGADRTDR
jgi:hypothetical protein